MIAGCHHQSVKQVVALAMHVKILGTILYNFTPYVAARDDETVFLNFTNIYAQR